MGQNGFVKACRSIKWQQKTLFSHNRLSSPVASLECASMFSYLRYVAVLCLLLVILGALGISYWFVNDKRNGLLADILSDQRAMIESYTTSVWRARTPVTPTPDATAFNFNVASSAFFSHQKLVKLSIFSPDVRQAFFNSTDVFVTLDGVSRVAVFDLATVNYGKAVARVLEHSYLSSAPAAPKSKTMVQLLVPIPKAGLTAADLDQCQKLPEPKCAPEAIAEVFVDVTADWAELTFLQYAITGGISGIFTVLIGMLLFTSYRAEAIITRQHEVNLELTSAAAQAEAQSRDKSQFLANISHELRTPLNAIIGFSEIIKNEAKEQLEKGYQNYLDDIHASGKHLLSLINDVLDYSKAEAGKLQIEWAETDASKVIRNSLRMVMPRAETAQVTLMEDIPAHHLVIVTDAKKLKQVLLNLLSNAVKFTPAGGEVRCHAWEDLIHAKLIIQVKDTGIGIAPKDISKVMMPFGQVDSTLARKYEGTGLGLPLSKKFVETMGGEFAIESELNVGTIVTLTIPKIPKNWSGSSTLTVQAPKAEGA
jgi:two-component system cell cycle sensor histidine kinase PleC